MHNKEETLGTKSSYLEKAGQGISPEGKARGKNETPTGQNLDTVSDKDARGWQGRKLKVQGSGSYWKKISQMPQDKTITEKIMSKRLSVANLPHEMTETQLQTLFSEAGHVASAKIIPYLHNEQPCGFGFVEMQTLAETRKAFSIFNGRTINGRFLAVREDRPASKCFFGTRSRNSR